MSEIISFRLCGKNMREKYASEILRTWRQKGYSSRLIIVDALLLWDKNQSTVAEEKNNSDLATVNAKLNFLIDMLGIKNNNSTNQIHQENLDGGDLSPIMLSAIRSNVRPGMSCK